MVACPIPPSLEGLRVLVVGMARSGVAAARLAIREGARVTCADLRTTVEAVPGCTMALGPHQRDIFLHTDIIVVSPGVPAHQPDLAAAAAAGVPIVGELALAASRISAPILAISGTNGKSTVTCFTGQLLAAAGLNPFVGGNLGRPLSEAVLANVPPDVCAVEVSSYQMEWPGTFTPAAAIILNLTPDHLARHGTMEVYGAMKCRMFDRMSSSAAAILPWGDALLPRLADGRGGRRLWLGGAPGAAVRGDAILLDDGVRAASLSLGQFKVPGAHNRLNLAAAALLCWAWGLDADHLDPRGLVALEHRMEPVADVDDVLWINDSKATNVAAALVGLGGLERPAVVLLGGEAKQGDDHAALATVLGGARAVICFGKDGPALADALEPHLAVHRVAWMGDAVRLARSLARPGDAVVLSPACASFDEFNNFEHRGAVFRDLARSRT